MDVVGSRVSEDVAAKSSMRFNNDKCKVCNLGPDKCWYQCRLGDEEVQSSPEVKDLRAASPTAGPAFYPFTLLSDLVWNTVSTLGVLSTGETWNCWSESRRGPHKQSEG